MRETVRRIAALLTLALLTQYAGYSALAQAHKHPPRAGHSAATASATVTEASVRRIMSVLASDSMRGRGSATPDELRAAQYIASQLRLYGVKPAGAAGGYLQRVTFTRPPRRGATNAAADQRVGHTTNVVGILSGSDPTLAKDAILLSAHLDHLGIGKPVNGDSIYNGADDDASGVTAVLELARVLSHGPRPKRTVVFALFGSEELGGYGAKYFQDHPPVPLQNIIANLEFEMIGRPDAAVAPHTLWLTGYERSNLGPELASHGARLVADPHPAEQFFTRSDNYVLAQKGIIAHTVSSFGLHLDYHQPSDELSKIDFAHMTEAIQSMIGPVEWLANSDFKPKWNEGGKP